MYLQAIPFKDANSILKNNENLQSLHNHNSKLNPIYSFEIVVPYITTLLFKYKKITMQLILLTIKIIVNMMTFKNLYINVVPYTNTSHNYSAISKSAYFTILHLYPLTSLSSYFFHLSFILSSLEIGTLSLCIPYTVLCYIKDRSID